MNLLALLSEQSETLRRQLEHLEPIKSHEKTLKRIIGTDKRIILKCLKKTFYPYTKKHFNITKILWNELYNVDVELFKELLLTRSFQDYIIAIIMDDNLYLYQAIYELDILDQDTIRHHFLLITSNDRKLLFQYLCSSPVVSHEPHISDYIDTVFKHNSQLILTYIIYHFDRFHETFNWFYSELLIESLVRDNDTVNLKLLFDNVKMDLSFCISECIVQKSFDAFELCLQEDILPKSNYYLICHTLERYYVNHQICEMIHRLKRFTKHKRHLLLLEQSSIKIFFKSTNKKRMYLLKYRLVPKSILETISSRNQRFYKSMCDYGQDELLETLVEMNINVQFSYVVQYILPFICSIGNVFLFRYFYKKCTPHIFQRKYAHFRNDCMFNAFMNKHEIFIVECLFDVFSHNIKLYYAPEIKRILPLYSSENTFPNTNLLILSAQHNMHLLFEKIYEAGIIDVCEYDCLVMKYVCSYENRDLMELCLSNEVVQEGYEYWIKLVLAELLELKSDSSADSREIKYYEEQLNYFYSYIIDPRPNAAVRHDSVSAAVRHDCSICMNALSNIIFQCNQCKQSTHFECMLKWFIQQDQNNQDDLFMIRDDTIFGTCPSCRAPHYLFYTHRCLCICSCVEQEDREACCCECPCDCECCEHRAPPPEHNYTITSINIQ
jgi:hypothetical protein